MLTKLTPPTHRRAAAQSERRVEPRFTARDVPWILSVRPLSGAAGRLLNISSTGVLLESGARMLPDRKNCILIETDDEQKERVDAIVIRTELVAIVRDADPIYRSALSFPKKLPSRLRERIAGLLGEHHTAVLLADPALAAEPARPQLAGPFEALWATEQESQIATVWQVTEAGCVVRGVGAAAIGQLASMRVYFSPTRHLLLTGRAAAVQGDGDIAVRFEQLSTEDRRALRVELRGRTFDRRVEATELPPSVATAGIALVHATTPSRPSVRANAW